ncbi:MAG TPA: STAS domain-containing protein [Mycobacteriales bacterium]|jgi:anti-sigma B factor antagonist|nr:anti-anti-sigma factor family protein [Mycobacterium sp.]
MAPTAVRPEAPGSVVTLTGRVDGATVASCREVLHRAVDSGRGLLVVDVSAVVLVDATGLAMLLGTARRAGHAGRRLVLRGTPPRVARLLRVTGLDVVLPTE